VGLEILVLGAGGMLGHKVLQHLVISGDAVGCTLHGSEIGGPVGAALFASVPTVINDFDVSDSQRALERIARLRPRVVINCIGVVKQRVSAKEFIPSISVNSLWPHLLAGAAEAWGGRVIHFSTDCVFSGKRGGYTEEDEPDPPDLYGRTKALGELCRPNSLTLRTSIIGRELNHYASLLEWLIAQKGGRVHGFTQVWFSGVTTNYLSRLVRILIYEHPELCGLYNLAGPKISKYDLVSLINQKLQLGVEIVPDGSSYLDRSLDGSRFVRATGLESPSWPQMLNELANDQSPYTR
jgi:dTDP-4-dehydrorhamnose reductase